MGHEIRPTPAAFETAHAIVDDAMETADEAFPLATDATVSIEWGHEDWIVEAVDGASGYTDYPDRIEIRFDTAATGWRASLRSTAVHEFAHVWAVERRGREPVTKWEYVLEEAFTQHVAKRLVPGYESPWWTKRDERTVAEYWERIRETELDAESEEAGPLFLDESEGGYPNGLGYSLAFQVGRVLLDDHDLTSFPTLDRDAVVAVGARLYER